jgi:hypothetical protein
VSDKASFLALAERIVLVAEAEERSETSHKGLG